MNKTILVVGGAGFIGSFLVERLIGKGHRVVVLDSMLLGTESNLKVVSGSPQLTLVKGDASDAQSCEQLFVQYQFDAVFHLAANSDIRAGSADSEIDLRNTFLTTYCIGKCCQKFGVKELVFASTSAIYGDKGGVPVSESDGPVLPISFYGAAKAASEAFLSAFAEMNGIQTWICRFPNVVGPRSTHGVIFDFIRKLKQDPQRLEILGDGRQAKPYIAVIDLVEAIFFIWENASALVNVFNISVKDQISVTRIAEVVSDELGLKNVEFTYTGGRAGWRGDVPQFQYDTSRLDTLGWRPRHSSEEAVRLAVRGNGEFR